MQKADRVPDPEAPTALRQVAGVEHQPKGLGARLEQVLVCGAKGRLSKGIGGIGGQWTLDTILIWQYPNRGCICSCPLVYLLAHNTARTKF